MKKFFETHRKEFISGAGVLLFMLAGALAMFIMPSENSQPHEEEPKPQNQNQIEVIKTESPPQKQERESNREIYVYLTGAVKKPGVYKFPEGSRIFEVIESAGGFTSKADIAALNLAETFSDAQHIHIPVKGERKRTDINTNTNTHVTVQASESKPKTKSSVSNSGLVDVNHASESELQMLNGVGPVIAKRIFDYRQKNGRFKSAEDLINVRGIGPAKLEKMRSQILIR